MEVDQLVTVLGTSAAVVLVAVTAVSISRRFGAPALLIHLAIGVGLGEAGLGINFDNAELAQRLAFGALAIILFEGGLNTPWREVRPVLGVGALLSTVAVGVSTSIVAAAAAVLLGYDWRPAFVLGAVVSSTDAAAVFSVLRGMTLPGRLRQTLEVESGANDPVAILLITTLVMQDGNPNLLKMVAGMGYELVIGVVVGIVAGRGIGWLLRGLPQLNSGLTSIALVGLAAGSYALADLVHASGFLAAYVAGVAAGSTRLPFRTATTAFADGLATMAQVGLFVMLGLLSSPSRLPQAIIPAVVVGVVLLLVARPVSVLLATVRSALRMRERLFLCAAGLRGAVPIAFATVPVTAGSPRGRDLLDLVFVLVAVLAVVQAPLLPLLARRLDVVGGLGPTTLPTEISPVGDLGANIVRFDVAVGSGLQGAYVYELRLPAQAVVALVVRDEKTIVATDDLRLRAGDAVVAVVPRDATDAVGARLHDLHRGGPLVRWHEQ